MKTWMKLSAVALAASLLVACGGDGDGADTSTDADASGVPAEALKPGGTFSVESPLADGGAMIERYLVHGVTRTGELVAGDAPDMMPNALVPLLVSAARSSNQEAAQAEAPSTLLEQQRAFYRQAWDAMAAHQGTRDPQVILGELADLDAPIVDFMDDAEVSGVSLQEYVAFYDRLNKLPEWADKAYAEWLLQDALSSGDKVSVLEQTPSACPEGYTRVVSVSKTTSYCRLPSHLNHRETGMAVDTSDVVRSSVGAMMQAPNVDQAIDDAIRQRIKELKAQLAKLDRDIPAMYTERDLLRSALAQNGVNTARWEAFCKAHWKYRCAGKPSSIYWNAQNEFQPQIFKIVSALQQSESLRSSIRRTLADLENPRPAPSAKPALSHWMENGAVSAP